MNYKIKVTRNFEKEAKPLIKKYASFKIDISRLIADLETNPEQGTSLGQHLFKIRLAIQSKGKGKSGGARVITYVLVENGSVYLLSVYDKADFDTADIDRLRKILADEGL